MIASRSENPAAGEEAGFLISSAALFIIIISASDSRIAQWKTRLLKKKPGF
jgi:hypothetical protein